MAKRIAVNGAGTKPRTRADRLWEGRVRTGKDPATGKSIYKSLRGVTVGEYAAKGGYSS